MARGGYRPNAGRPKAQHTIQAEKAKAELIKLFLKQKTPIFKTLIKRAVDGDMAAMKELFERVWGKESQPFTGDLNHTFDDIAPELYKAIIERERNRIKVSGD
jgi:hypothetical protein